MTSQLQTEAYFGGKKKTGEKSREKSESQIGGRKIQNGKKSETRKSESDQNRETHESESRQKSDQSESQKHPRREKSKSQS